MRSLHYWWRHKFKFLFLIIFLIAVAGLQSGWFNIGVKKAEQTQPGLYSINHFIDGDTISVNMNGNVETVRMIGVDTPETHKPNTPVQCYGPEAANYTKQLIGQQAVRLQADSLDTNRDRYDRLLRYVYLSDGTLVESKLIAEGYGFAYTLFPFEKKDEFKTNMASAQTAHKGLWTACQVHQEPNGAYQSNSAQ